MDDGQPREPRTRRRSLHLQVVLLTDTQALHESRSKPVEVASWHHPWLSSHPLRNMCFTEDIASDPTSFPAPIRYPNILSVGFFWEAEQLSELAGVNNETGLQSLL